MSNVVQLPDTMHRAWAAYERELRTALIAHNTTAAEIDYVITAVRPAFLECSQPYSFAGAPDQALKALNEWVFQQTSGLLTRLVGAELKVYRAQQNGAS